MRHTKILFMVLLIVLSFRIASAIPYGSTILATDELCRANSDPYCFNDGCIQTEDGDCYARPEAKVEGWTPGTLGAAVVNGDLNPMWYSDYVPSTGYVLYSDYFDLKPDTQYNLSFYLSNACGLTVGFDGTCIDGATNLRTDCGINARIDAPSLGNERFFSLVFTIPSNAHLTNGLYFKDVRLVLNGSKCDKSNPIIHDIFLKEITFANAYASSPNGVDNSGCCPADYCWNGSVCINSNFWMGNSSRPPVWNNLDIINQQDNHINGADRFKSIGYRCILNSSGIANWVPSDIKYDWDYKTSGYCAKPTDCFVSESYPQLDAAYSKGCIHDGDTIGIVDGVYKFGSGNHYCHQGNWTTKSYIIAQLLQSLSTDAPYTLHCYDNASMIFNKASLDADKGIRIASACVLVKTVDDSQDQIITGVVLSDDSYAGSFMTALKKDYNSTYGENDDSKNIYALANCNAVRNTNFSTCADVENESTGNKFYVYYERNYKYFLISNDKIEGLSSFTVWEKISGFFKGLFTFNKYELMPYDATNYTTSYDRIYVMNNPSGPNVLGIEEYKYDEASGRMVTILEVNYNGSNQTTNPINLSQLLRAANKTVTENEADARIQSDINDAQNRQEVIIQTENRTGLWSYFTTISRVARE